MQVEPGTAQNIPGALRWVILAVAIVAVVLTSAWGKIWQLLRERGKKKEVPK